MPSGASDLLGDGDQHAAAGDRARGRGRTRTRATTRGPLSTRYMVPPSGLQPSPLEIVRPSSITLDPPVPIEPVERAASGVVVVGQGAGPESALRVAGAVVHPRPGRGRPRRAGARVPSGLRWTKPRPAASSQPRHPRWARSRRPSRAPGSRAPGRARRRRRPGRGRRARPGCRPAAARRGGRPSGRLRRAAVCSVVQATAALCASESAPSVRRVSRDASRRSRGWRGRASRRRRPGRRTRSAAGSASRCRRAGRSGR